MGHFQSKSIKTNLRLVETKPIDFAANLQSHVSAFEHHFKSRNNDSPIQVCYESINGAPHLRLWRSLRLAKHFRPRFWSAPGVLEAGGILRRSGRSGHIPNILNVLAITLGVRNLMIRNLQQKKFDTNLKQSGPQTMHFAIHLLWITNGVEHNLESIMLTSSQETCKFLIGLPLWDSASWRFALWCILLSAGQIGVRLLNSGCSSVRNRLCTTWHKMFPDTKCIMTCYLPNGGLASIVFRIVIWGRGPAEASMQKSLFVRMWDPITAQVWRAAVLLIANLLIAFHKRIVLLMQ